jgi:hypothetical protein
MSENKINTTDKLLETLKSQLRHHDWFYEYSDDSRYYNSGLREFQQIWQTIEKLQEIGENEFDLAIALYKQYKPVVKTPHEQVVTK